MNVRASQVCMITATSSALLSDQAKRYFSISAKNMSSVCVYQTKHLIVSEHTLGLRDFIVPSDVSEVKTLARNRKG